MIKIFIHEIDKQIAITKELYEKTKSHSFPIWEGIENSYAREHMPRIQRFFYTYFSPFIKIYLKYLLRKDRKRYQSVKQRKFILQESELTQ